MMVVLEGLLSSYFFGHKVKKDLLPGVGMAASIVLWVYVVLRLVDLAVRGDLGMAFDGSWQSLLFLFELGGIPRICPVVSAIDTTGIGQVVEAADAPVNV